MQNHLSADFLFPVIRLDLLVRERGGGTPSQKETSVLLLGRMGEGQRVLSVFAA